MTLVMIWKRTRKTPTMAKQMEQNMGNQNGTRVIQGLYRDRLTLLL